MTIISTTEHKFITDAIAQSLRIDLRSPSEIRKIKIALGPPLGHAVITLGKTRVSASVSAEITRPTPSNPTEGSIVFSTQFIANSHQESKSSNAAQECRNEEVHTSQILEKALRKSRAVDTEGLCIVAGEKVWSIKVHIRILDNDGNALDCAILAAMTAILHFKRPDVSVSGTDITLHSPDEKVPIALGIHHIPISLSFAFFSNGHWVIDPSLIEEQVCETKITICVNVHRELCTMSMAGKTITMDQIMHVVHIAGLKAQEITKIIKDSVDMVIKL